MKLRNPLLDKKITVAEKRVLMLAGSDMDFPHPPFSRAEHRLIISDDARPEPWQRENLVGWQIRRIPAEPLCRFVISDDHGVIEFLDETYKFQGFATVDGADLQKLVEYFERLWCAGSRYSPVFGERLVESIRNEIAPGTTASWSDILRRLAVFPEQLRTIGPTAFEELIAELLRRDGMEVEMTQSTRDGGRDILAWSTTPAGRTLCYVECKRYAPNRKVSVTALRALYGVLEAGRANTAMLVTTSDFTAPARTLKLQVGNRLLLRNYGELVKWIRRSADRAT